MLVDGLTVVCGAVVSEHLFEKTVERLVIGHHLCQHRQQEVDGDGVEIVVDIELVGPHRAVADGTTDGEDGIAGLDTTTEGVAVGRETGIVIVELEGEELENHHLVGGVAVDHAFLARTHLVDGLLRGDAQAFAIGDALCQREVGFTLHIVVGILELMPGETAFHQPVGKKFLPGLLSDELVQDTIHKYKGKRVKKEKGE